MRVRTRYASARAVSMARARRQGRGKMLSSSRFAKSTSVNQNSSIARTGKTQSSTQTKQIEIFEEMQKGANNLKKQVDSLFSYCKNLKEEQEKAAYQKADTETVNQKDNQVTTVETTTGSEKQTTSETEKKKELEKTEENKDTILSYAKKIINNYNMIMEDLGEVGNNTCVAFQTQLKTLVKSYEKDLKQVGITIDRKGMLNLDEKEAGKVDLTTMETVFGKSYGVFGKLRDKCASIESNASTSIQILNRLYGTSSVYSKYGKNTAYYGTNGNYYSALG